MLISEKDFDDNYTYIDAKHVTFANRVFRVIGFHTGTRQMELREVDNLCIK